MLVSSKTTCPFPRHLYGDFLVGVLEAAREGRDVRHHRAWATRLGKTKDGFRVCLAQGGDVAARAVVLALGNLPPQRIAADRSDPRIIEDPWSMGPGTGIGCDRILVAGAGLTALDAVVALAANNARAHFMLCAAHPFLPAVDRIVPPWPNGAAMIGQSPAELWRAASGAIRGHGDPARGWYEVVDGIRPYTEEIWEAWSNPERRSFAVHAARHWLHRRHRIPPATSSAIDRLIAARRLSIHPGRISAIRPDRAELAVTVGSREVVANLVVNATGPSLSLHDHPLLRDALAAGLASPDPLGLGIATTREGVVRDRGGVPVPGLYALGPLTRGTFFEIVAVPHIRKRAGQIAEGLVP